MLERRQTKKECSKLMSTSCSMYLKPRESACVASNAIRRAFADAGSWCSAQSGPDLAQMDGRVGWRRNWVPTAETLMHETARVQAGLEGVADIP